jgi:hypothetical protein
MLIRILPLGPWPPLGPQTCTTAWGATGDVARSPKLQPLVVAAVCSATNVPTFATPRPLTAAPRATMLPDWFHTIQTVPSWATIEGWSTLPLNEARLAQLAPPSRLSLVTMALVPPLMKVA